MAEDKRLQDMIQAAMGDVLGQLAESSAGMLDALARGQERSVARLSNAADALAGELGEEDPQVLELRQAHQELARYKDSLRAVAAQEMHAPDIRPYEWAVFGVVLDSSGQPVPRVRVRLFDLDRKYDDILGEKLTDQSGAFAIVYHERSFREAGEDLPELYLLILDDQGNTLYSSRDNVRFQAGRLEYFEVVLPAQG